MTRNRTIKLIFMISEIYRAMDFAVDSKIATRVPEFSSKRVRNLILEPALNPPRKEDNFTQGIQFRGLAPIQAVTDLAALLIRAEQLKSQHERSQ